MDRGILIQALEAVLFASSEPLAIAKLQAVFAPEGVGAQELREAIESLRGMSAGRGVEVREVGGGYQLRTRPETARWVARLEEQKAVRFSRAALETLAVVAYRQPVTRAEAEEVRGVDSGGVLKSLLDKGLVRIVGRKDVPGRPLLYGTTRKFLEVFGLGALSELPTMRDIASILAEHAEGVDVGGEEGATDAESAVQDPEGGEP